MCSVLPSLAAFKRKIGVVGHFDLAAPLRSANLTFAINEDWWQDFINLVGKASKIIDERHDADLAKLDALEVQKTSLTKEKLRALIRLRA